MNNLTGKHEDCEIGMCWWSKAWWRTNGDAPQINIGAYYEDGSTTGYFSITWQYLGKEIGLAPRLDIYSDAWSLLPQIAPVLAVLAELDGTNPTDKQVFDALLKAGVKDRTEYVNPRNPTK